MVENGIYIQLFSIHGLVRGQNLEMGRNADTGGQVKYVVELARALGKPPGVAKVDLFTRLLRDKTLSPDYSQPLEPLSENVRLVRIPCGGGRYIRKELLWPHLDEFVNNTLRFIQQESGFPRRHSRPLCRRRFRGVGARPPPRDAVYFHRAFAGPQQKAHAD